MGAKQAFSQAANCAAVCLMLRNRDRREVEALTATGARRRTLRGRSCGETVWLSSGLADAALVAPDLPDDRAARGFHPFPRHQAADHAGDQVAEAGHDVAVDGGLLFLGGSVARRAPERRRDRPTRSSLPGHLLNTCQLERTDRGVRRDESLGLPREPNRIHVVDGFLSSAGRRSRRAPRAMHARAATPQARHSRRGSPPRAPSPWLKPESRLQYRKGARVALALTLFALAGLHRRAPQNPVGTFACGLRLPPPPVLT